jgi:hypothetical protein
MGSEWEWESSGVGFPRTPEKRKLFLNVIEKELPNKIKMKLKTSEVNMEDRIGDDFVEFVERVRVKYDLHSIPKPNIDLKESIHFQFFLSIVHSIHLMVFTKQTTKIHWELSFEDTRNKFVYIEWLLKVFEFAVWTFVVFNFDSLNKCLVPEDI